VKTITKKHTAAATVFSLFCAAFVAFSLGSCAEYPTATTPRPEARYDTYYGPDYYPYYPWYSYYGGAYYSGY
jgi:hypothetical protein